MLLNVVFEPIKKLRLSAEKTLTLTLHAAKALIKKYGI
jgi:hypothetical protein